jgi:hypothetical protein
LKARRRPVELRMYNDAQHGLGDKISQEVDVWVETAKFFLKYDQNSADADAGAKASAECKQEKQ